MIGLIVTYTINKAFTREEFYSSLVSNEIISRTLEESGCINYQFCFPASGENSLILLEAWESTAHSTAHKGTPQCRKLQELKSKYVSNTAFTSYELLE